MELPDIKGTLEALKVLTWKHLSIALSLALIFTVTMIFWGTRDSIYERVKIHINRLALDTIPYPSNRIQSQIKNIVQKVPSIVAIEEVNMDFKRNEKQPIYFFSKIEKFQIVIDDYKAKKIAQSPMWTTDQESNLRMVKILNGEFVCVPVPARFIVAVPETIHYAKTICSLPVPPDSYGKITGYVNIWLSEPPSNDNIIDYRTLLRSLCVEIYERDIKGTE